MRAGAAETARLRANLDEARDMVHRRVLCVRARVCAFVCVCVCVYVSVSGC